MLEVLDREQTEPHRETLWQDQEAAYQLFSRLDTESPEEVFGAAKLEAATAIKPTFIACVDERVKPEDRSLPKIGVAGCGILWSAEQRATFIQNLRDEGIAPQEANWHKHCGACGEYCKGHPGQTPEQAGSQAAATLAAELGGETKVSTSGYGPEDVPMLEPADFHPARAIFVDGTGRFNPSALNLPSELHGFLLSGRYYPDMETLAGETRFVENIAMGGHGFGERFTADAPLLLVLIGDKRSDVWGADELEKHLGSSPYQEENRTKVLKLDI